MCRPGRGFRHPLRSPLRDNAHRSARSATLILTGATNFKNYHDVSADPAQRNTATLAAIGKKSYETLRAEHIRDHQALFRRVSLDLGATRRRQAAHRRAHRRLRHRQRSRAGRAALPVRPLPDDRRQPPRRPARQPAGPLERFQHARLGQQVHRQHQHRNELLAGGGDQPLRVPPAAVRRAQGTGAIRRHHREGALQRARLGAASQFRSVARHGAHQRQQSRHLADRRRVALHPPLGALPVHRRSRIPARHRLPADERRGARSSSTPW